jgi:hypothetical protein
MNIKFKEVSINEIPKQLLLGASQNVFIKNYIYIKNLKKKRILILYNNIMVGFFNPLVRGQCYRLIAIYISNEFRNLGIATETIKIFTENKNSRAVIDEKNIASQKAFSKSGFIKTDKKIILKGNKLAYEWIKQGGPNGLD